VAAGVDVAELDRLSGLLKAAKYGVAVWSPGRLDALAIEMLVGLVKDLNAETRWAGLSLTADLTAVGAGMAAGWMTGFPLRTGFGRGYPEHDPWRFDAERLVRSGEADAVVWVSAFGEPPPNWLGGVPAVVLTDSFRPAGRQGIALPVGRPGLDHDGIIYDRRTGTLVELSAAAPSSKPSAAEALNRIAESLPA
jgi:formylmethanofuran dehydrogenase subunit B